ncbi:hypothetical protein GCM10010276_77830 [Streptomyces longisporus]|uniref:Uncharacterized protein n=1 Tax=Streptomyces longisporus TaxID=1948 RepID=A0ABN3N9R3_STRLO
MHVGCSKARDTAASAASPRGCTAVTPGQLPEQLAHQKGTRLHQMPNPPSKGRS